MTGEFNKLKEYLNRPAEGSDLSDPQAAFAEPLFKTFFLAARGRRPVSKLDPVLAELAEIIENHNDPFRAAQAAIICGTLVEYGANPATAAPACVSRLARSAPLMLSHLRSKSEQINDESKAFAGAQFLILALMTMLSRAVEERIRARMNKEFMQQIFELGEADKKNKVPYLQFLLSLMESYDGGLTLIFPELQSGLRLRLEAVQNNFHLFSLIQANLGTLAKGLGLPSYQLVDPELKSYIHGDAFNQADLPKKDLARHGFSDYSGYAAIKEGGKGFKGFLPGESYPKLLPKVGSDRIILMSKAPIFGSRSWDLKFFPPLHDALRTRFEVLEILSPEALQKLTQKIESQINADSASKGGSKPWWKVW